jgi:hypothetical protein
MPAQPAAGSGVVRAGVVARRARGTPGDVRAGRRAGGKSRVDAGVGPWRDREVSRRARARKTRLLKDTAPARSMPHGRLPRELGGFSRPARSWHPGGRPLYPAH